MTTEHAHQHNNERRVAWAAVLTGLFMLVEIAGGVISGSLALLADAGHMLADFIALAMAWAAFRVARRASDWRHNFGFDRFQILVAFVNGLSLFAIAGWIIYEANGRLNAPNEILGDWMLAIAIAGLIVNVAALAVLAGAERDNLNIRAAALHVMGELLGSAAAIVAALIIILIGWLPANPLLSVLVTLLILRSAFVVVKKSGHILLEGAPDELDTKTVAAELISEIPEIVGVHHVHAWSITQERPMMTLHARISSPPGAPATNFGAVVAAIKDRLAERFGVTHATVEIEHGEPD